ncbi:hypothetical protein FVE85_6908 [Porphyridium purpureum]|uniref:BRK domain-containing protein n=1 Tax=Porphyridium purpureum TaxID=35688 RepID=A0A5J4Z985_PORPP|nr:hypothetical protein FVE85_6908 [Porphyridium purpureum]|eukprot:POR7687..scf295_1
MVGLGSPITPGSGVPLVVAPARDAAAHAVLSPVMKLTHERKASAPVPIVNGKNAHTHASLDEDTERDAGNSLSVFCEAIHRSESCSSTPEFKALEHSSAVSAPEHSLLSNAMRAREALESNEDAHTEPKAIGTTELASSSVVTTAAAQRASSALLATSVPVSRAVPPRPHQQLPSGSPPSVRFASGICTPPRSGILAPMGFPPFTASLFGAAPEDEHVTVWDPSTGKTIAGNAAPYRKNLSQWLAKNPNFCEKSDELKSSKRRSQNRRAKSAASLFAELCLMPELTQHIIRQLEGVLGESRENEVFPIAMDEDDEPDWSSEEYVRLEEGLCHLGEELLRASSSATSSGGGSIDNEAGSRGVLRAVTEAQWTALTSTIGTEKTQREVLSRSLAVLVRASHLASMALQSQNHALQASLDDAMGDDDDDEEGARPPKRSNSASLLVSLASPGSAMATGFGPDAGGLLMPALSLPPAAMSFMDRSFRVPREPRITVWEPITGRTVSGNAAPCRRNLDQWLTAHPGWVPKGEENLSNSRRARHRKQSRSTASSTNNTPAHGPAPDPIAPSLTAALEGLLLMKQSPAVNSAPHPRLDRSAGTELASFSLGERSGAAAGVSSAAGVASGVTPVRAAGGPLDSSSISEGGNSSDSEEHGRAGVSGLARRGTKRNSESMEPLESMGATK